MVDTRPNVVLIHTHDLGRYLGCYECDIATPQIDSLAADGALFERHFVTAPQCSPSRGSLNTGHYPHVNGLMGLAHGNWELNEGETVLPQYLGNLGYETHLFGLQHISQDTDRLGYHHVHSEGNLYPGVTPEIHQANRARNVASVLASTLEKRAYESPFFASVGFFECHRIEKSNGRFGFDADFYDTDEPNEIHPLQYLPDRRGIRHDLAVMRGMVYAIDDAVGTILTAIENAEIADETVVIFTTEHGIAFPRAKGSCYDPGIEAALLFRYPDHITAGIRYDELISNVDVVPTILDLVNADVDVDFDGKSFVNLLIDNGAEYENRDAIFAEMTWHDMYNPVRAVRTDRFKYIRNFWHLPKIYLTKDIFASESGREIRESDGIPPRPYEELYDIRDAPQEDKNVVNEPRYQENRMELSEQLYEWMTETNDPLLTGPVVPGDFDVIQSWAHRRNNLS